MGRLFVSAALCALGVTFATNHSHEAVYYSSRPGFHIRLFYWLQANPLLLGAACVLLLALVFALALFWRLRER